MTKRRVLDVDIDAFDRATAAAGPPTPDDQAVLTDGRRLDSPERVMDWMVGVGAVTEDEARELLAHR